jgi:IS605 OrfB family transposase
LINGQIIKSINQWYNKNPCKTRSKKRYFRIQNYFHNVSKIIVENCIKYGIGKIIIGKNDGCKIKMNLGKRNNQNFQFIPIFLLLEKIKYKAEISGIEVIFTEESYTSQSSFYDNDPLPRYGEKEVEFSGKRKYRGLYVTKDGFALNADINGSLNIGRKVIPEFLGIGDRSLAARPVIVNPLRKLNGEGLAVNN